MYQDNNMSKEYPSLVTRKGQITIPAEVRRLLDISEGDRVMIIVDDNQQVSLARTESAVARTAGMLRSKRAPLSAEELRAVGERAIAEAVAERSGV